MNIRKILTAAAAASIMSVAGIAAASADPYDHGRDYHDRDTSRDHDGWRRGGDLRHDRFANRDRIYESLRYRHIRFYGDPFFAHGHYVVRSFDRFGHVTFVEVNPYTGGFIGFIRL
jgi:hypothetical protein